MDRQREMTPMDRDEFDLTLSAYATRRLQEESPGMTFPWVARLLADVVETARTLAYPDAPQSPTPEPDRRCRCDGAAYETKRHPFLVNSACPMHGSPDGGADRG